MNLDLSKFKPRRASFDAADIEKPTDSVYKPPIYVSKESECHVTPQDVAERMAQQLPDGGSLLEPSAGTGSLIRAAMAWCSFDSITAVECNQSLVAGLREQFGNDVFVRAHDFTTWRTDRRFDAVIINPPFRQAKAHMARAIELLKPDGVCVALLPMTFDIDSLDCQASEFERLPTNTFASTKVHTKLVYLIKED